MQRAAIDELMRAGNVDDAARALSRVPAPEIARTLLAQPDPIRVATLEALAHCSADRDDAQAVGFLNEPLRTAVSQRAGWLTVLLIGQMFTANVLDYFDEQLEKALVLALFIPMILSSGGNSGAQASTLLIRAMATGQARLRDWAQVLRRELIVGTALGLILGVVSFGRIVLFRDKYPEDWLGIGVTISLSTAAVVLCGCLLGSLLPLIMRLIRVDPAASSAPFVATLCDVCGLIIYFLIAIAVLRGTLL